MKIKVKSSVLAHRPIAHGGRSFLNSTNPQIIDFSSNISPAKMPPFLRSILKTKLDRIQDYPDLHSTRFLAELRKYTRQPPSNILVGNGAIEIIYNFCNALLSKKRVLIHAPTFGEYELAAKLADCKITLFKTMNLAENLDAFISKIPKNGCVFVCNPNNPTGTLLLKKQLKKIIHTAHRKQCFVFVDECFIELVPQSNESILSMISQYDNLFVLRSLTKSFGLAGIRIGYGCASKQIIAILQKIKIPWSVNALAQEAGILALQNKDHLLKSKLIIKKEYDFLYNKITNITGFECYDSVTNFILIKINQNSTKLQARLLEHKILVRDCKNFKGLAGNHIRIAIKSHRDNLKLIQAMEAVT